MKEATGELNMTVVTLIAIAAIAGLFYWAIWPMIQQMLVQQTCNTYGTQYVAVKDKKAVSQNSQATINTWCCCPNSDAQNCSAAGCVVVKSDEEEAGE